MKSSSQPSIRNNMPIIRIAPVCNGKIYVVPRPTADGSNLRFDLPIEESVEHVSTKSDKAACKVKEKYHLHLHTEASPRFCVQHKSESNKSIVFLYVLPLKKEEEISFCEGTFITAEDIFTYPERYNSNLQLESELLGMAAELWNDFYTLDS